jgi:phage baseplate assembly protein W
VAYVIGRKVIKDTESEFDSVAYGITSPTKRGNVMFEQTFTSLDAAKSNLRNLLLTKRGERVMQPNFGTGLHSLLFEPMDNEFEQKLQETITNSVRFWLPYITIENIEVDMSDEMKDRHTAGMKIEFTVGNNIETQEITFTVQG